MRRLRDILPYLSGLLIFTVLNVLMLHYNWEAWTSLKYGFWSVFHKRLCMSGFDPHTYVTISQWRPSWTLLRHPLLAIYCLPFSELNEWIKSTFHINGAIIIAGTLWTLFSTASWALLYKILHRLLEMTMTEALLLTTLFFSFAYVMLATFVADHMLITTTLLLYLLYTTGMSIKSHECPKTWKTLLMFFIGTGVTTTNAVKIWLIDIISRWRSGHYSELLVHSVKYYLPVTILMIGLYFWQEKTIIASEEASIERQEKKRLATDRSFVEKVQKLKADTEKRHSKQLSDSKLFEYTDNSIGIVPSLVHNIFGEGLQLHSSHLLKDVNRNERPSIVRYSEGQSLGVAVINYTVEALVALLFVIGIWCGRRSRFFWMVLSGFLFDMFLHLVLCFALADVYIMTAHWAVVIPVAIAFLIRSIRSYPPLYYTTMVTISVLALWMWGYNLSLIVPYILR